jgi:hypothetical protein
VALAADGTGSISASGGGILKLLQHRNWEVVRDFGGQLGKLRNGD